MQNSYNNPFNRYRQITQALAAMISGDKTLFYKCGFFGFQDTLWAVEGRQFYKKCTIQGAIDFIFGHAQAVFQVKLVFLVILNCKVNESETNF